MRWGRRWEWCLKTRLRHIWEILTSSYWFVPSLMAMGSVVLAFGMLTIDQAYSKVGPRIGWLYAGGVQGARSLLSVVASSTITVAGVVFSITLTTLTQTSNQFGPRLLRNFMRDTGNQVVLGTFVATFIYSILVLRAIYGNDDTARVPQASVTTGVLLAVASLSVLIYFIHHVSLSLQAPQVVANVADELSRALPHQFPSGLGQAGAPVESGCFAGGCEVSSSKEGYLQVVDQEALMRNVIEKDLRIELYVRPGHFLMHGTPLMRLSPASRCTDELAERLNGHFIVGAHRTPEQDVEYALHQLVEIAVRSLSPGINDPFTAINCVDWLGVSLGRIVRKGLPDRWRYDDFGQLRVMAPVPDIAGVVDASFNQIRQLGAGHPAVMIRLLEVIESLLGQLKTVEDVRMLIAHADMIREDGLKGVQQERDRNDLERRHAAVYRARQDLEKA